MIDSKGAGLVVKVPKDRVASAIASGEGKAFAPAGRAFKEWLSVPEPDRRRWLRLLREGIELVGACPNPNALESMSAYFPPIGPGALTCSSKSLFHSPSTLTCAAAPFRIASIRL